MVRLIIGYYQQQSKKGPNKYQVQCMILQIGPALLLHWTCIGLDTAYTLTQNELGFGVFS
jgi:hypothetical protein